MKRCGGGYHATAWQPYAGLIFSRVVTLMKLTFTAKLILILIVLILFLLTAPAGAVAADDLILTVSEAAGSVGDTIIVKVNIENAANTEGGQFVLSFDPELLRPVSIEAEEFITGSADSMDMANLEYAKGQLKFIWVTAYADTDDSGTLCTVNFELLKEGESLLEINEVVISPEGIDTIVEPGSMIILGNGVTEPAEEYEPEADLDEAADGEEVEDEVIGTSIVLIIIAVIAVLAVAGLLYTKISKKPGAKHVKKK